jgi:glycosyltransferase involved in cell wall biosynthesis
MSPLWGHYGGREQYVLTCVEELVRRGHACAIAYGRRSIKQLAELLPPIPQYQLRAYSEFESDQDNMEVEHLNRVLEIEKPEVVFMSDIKNYALMNCLVSYGGLVPMSHDNFLSCMRTVTTTYLRRAPCEHSLGKRCLLHGCFLKKNTNGGLMVNNLSRHQRLLDIYRNLKIHVVASNYVKDRLLQHGFRPSQVRVIPYFTDMTPSVVARSESKPPLILFVGRIDRYKGVEYLLRALAHVSTPFKCEIIGDGDRVPYCKSVASMLDLEDRVKFLGWLEQEEIVDRLRSAYVQVVPSVWPEPFGIVGLEAMTCSKPVIAFDVGGISDWLKNGENGYLVPAKNTAVLAERIEELLKDSWTAARMGTNGYHLVTSRFPKEQHFDLLMSCFEEAAAERTRNNTVRTPDSPAEIQ